MDVGGLLTSTLCEFAVPLNAWVPQDKHWEVGYAIMTTFRDFGYRYIPPHYVYVWIYRYVDRSIER